MTPKALFGQRLKDMRKAHNWTQADVVRHMKNAGYGWHQTTTSKTESAVRPVSLDEAAELAALFGVSLSTLVDGIDREVQASADSRRLDTAKHAVRDAYRAYQEAQQRYDELSQETS